MRIFILLIILQYILSAQYSSSVTTGIYQNSTCGSNAVCTNYRCVNITNSCNSTCTPYQECIGSVCIIIPCNNSCTNNQMCVNNTCINDPCSLCNKYQTCISNRCVNLPCFGICNNLQTCINNVCVYRCDCAKSERYLLKLI